MKFSEWLLLIQPALLFYLFAVLRKQLCHTNSWQFPRATDFLVPKSELQGLISHQEWAGPFHFLLQCALFFPPVGGVFLSHYPNCSPQNAVFNCISLVADRLKENIHAGVFQCIFFFCCFSTPSISACYQGSQRIVEYMLCSTGWISLLILRKLYKYFLVKLRIKNTLFAILIQIQNDEFRIIKTYHFIIYVLEYCSLEGKFLLFLLKHCKIQYSKQDP